MDLARIGILGGGSWGTALSLVLKNNNNDVDIWLRDNKQVEEILETRENRKYLPGVFLPKEIGITSDIEKAIYKKDILVLAVPSHSVRQVLNECKHLIDKSQILLNVAKGIENDTLYRVSQIVNSILPDNSYAVLSGPSHAEEVALNMPTTVVAASNNMEVAEYIQDVFMGKVPSQV
jgi:glycerol-3-phosphate dehydrogenase (NAD(P)+)